MLQSTVATNVLKVRLLLLTVCKVHSLLMVHPVLLRTVPAPQCSSSVDTPDRHSRHDVDKQCLSNGTTAALVLDTALLDSTPTSCVQLVPVNILIE